MSKQKYEYHAEFSGVPCNLCFDVDVGHIGKTLVLDGAVLTIQALYLNYDKQVLHLQYASSRVLDVPETFWTKNRIDALANDIGFYHELQLQRAKTLRNTFLKPLLAIALGLVLVAMMLVASIIPEALMIAGVVVGAAATLYMALPSIKAFIKGLRSPAGGVRHWLTMDAVYLLASLIMLGVSIAAFFVPGLPMMMEAGLLLFGFKALGEAISSKMRQQQSIPVRFRDIIPKTILRWQGDMAEEIDSAALLVGDEVSLPQRKYCPVDATLQGNRAILVDESRLNGQSEPVLKRPGDIIYQGSAIVDAQESRLQVLRLGEDSHLARQDALLLPKAQVTHTSLMVRVYLPAIMVLALLVSLILGFTLGIAPALKIGLLILVSACPCALSLGGALEHQYAAKLARSRRAEIKPGASLAALGDIDRVMLDINGTLTEGKPSVMRFASMPDCDMAEEALLAQAYRLERAALASHPHPVARAIAEYSLAKIEPQDKDSLCELQMQHNGFFDARSGYALGNADFWRARGVDTVGVEAAAGETNWVYFGKDNTIMAVFALGDVLREGVLEQLKTLRAAGKMLCLATGASRETAEVYRRALSLPQKAVHSSLASDGSALSKLSLLRQLQQQGQRVLFIGDGENDTQALAQANMSMAIKNTHLLTTAQTQADVVLTDFQHPKQTWSAIGGLFQDAAKVRRLHTQNMVLVLGLNLASMAVCAGLVLGLGLALNPWIMALSMILQMVVVVINTLRQEVPAFEKAPEKRLLDVDCSVKQDANPPESSACKPSLAYGLTRL